MHAGFAIELDCFDPALDAPQQITVFSDMANRGRALSDLHGISVIEKTHEQGILAWLAQGLIENQPLNLLQGDYRYIFINKRFHLLTCPEGEVSLKA